MTPFLRSTFTAEQTEAMQQAFNTYKQTGEPDENQTLLKYYSHVEQHALWNSFFAFCLEKGIDVGTNEGISEFVEQLVNQIKADIERRLAKYDGKFVCFCGIGFLLGTSFERPGKTSYIFGFKISFAVTGGHWEKPEPEREKTEQEKEYTKFCSNAIAQAEAAGLPFCMLEIRQAAAEHLKTLYN